MLVGNKIDLKTKLNEKNGRKMAQECNAWFALVSAKTGENVPQAFEAMNRFVDVKTRFQTP